MYLLPPMSMNTISTPSATLITFSRWWFHMPKTQTRISMSRRWENSNPHWEMLTHTHIPLSRKQSICLNSMPGWLTRARSTALWAMSIPAIHVMMVGTQRTWGFERNEALKTMVVKTTIGGRNKRRGVAEYASKRHQEAWRERLEI